MFSTKPSPLKGISQLIICFLPIAVLWLNFKTCFSCSAPNDCDFSEAPRYWCSLFATIDVQSSCTLHVTEIVTVPWTTDQFVRIIPHQQNQHIVSVEAFINSFDSSNSTIPGNAVNDNAVKADSVTVSLQGGLGTAVTVTTNLSRLPTTIIVQYVVIPGVVAFSSCGDGAPALPSFPPPYPQDMESSSMKVMLVRWAIGGLSVPRVLTTMTKFRVQFSLDRGLLDVFSYLPSLDSSMSNDSSQIIVTVSGNTSSAFPADIILYSRPWRRASRLPCAAPRDCRSERILLKEGKPRRIWRGIVIVVSTVCTVGVCVLVGVLIWIRRVHRGDDENEDAQSARDVEIPKSLQHFAFDTGDEASSRTWRQWMDAVSGKSIPGINSRLSDNSIS